ncbi:MAG: NUDIX hydrolase [Ornithinibacter sp.]
MRAPSHAVSAGALPWRIGADGTPQVLLVHRRKYRDWAIPKGNTKPRESASACARREVLEETGLACQLHWTLPTLHYLTRRGEPKSAHYWAATPTSGAFRPNNEVDAVCWVDLAEAAMTLTKPRERAIPLALAARLRTEPGLSAGGRERQVLLVRCAPATPRERWVHDDVARPLTAEGEHLARSLVSLTSMFEVKHVMSAPARRCLDTVTPLAMGQSLVVEVSESLTDGRLLDAQGVVDRVRGTGSVVCTHEDVISAVLRRLEVRDHITMSPDLGRRRGSVWILTGDEHRYTAAHYLPMPETLADVAKQARTSANSSTSTWGAA